MLLDCIIIEYWLLKNIVDIIDGLKKIEVIKFLIFKLKTYICIT